MRYFLPIFVLLIVILGCKAPETKKEAETGPFANQGALRDRITSLFKMQKGWGSIEIRKLEKNAITVYLHYKSMPSNMTAVSVDTKMIAQRIIDDLVKQGYDPRKEWLALFVHAQMGETGASGGQMVRKFGKAKYNFNSDSIEFEAAQ